jgi:hypothetical protein
MLDWRVTSLEERMDELEAKPSLPALQEGMSWGRIALLAALLFAGLKGHLSPETAFGLARGLLGIAWP